PMEPEAPGLFSTMNCCLSASLSLAATRRASGSTEPAGGNGTTNETGFEGQSCARAGTAAASNNTRTLTIDLIMYVLLSTNFNQCNDAQGAHFRYRRDHSRLAPRHQRRLCRGGRGARAQGRLGRRDQQIPPPFPKGNRQRRASRLQLRRRASHE